MGFPALDGIEFIQGSNLLGVALAARMRIAEEAKAKAIADALQKIAASSEPEMRKYLLCECVDAYLPLEEVQMKEYEQLLITPAYQGARKYGKTSFELGHERGKLEGMVEGAQKLMQKLILKLLTQRFGPLSEEVRKRIASRSEDQLLELAAKISTSSSLRELGSAKCCASRIGFPRTCRVRGNACGGQKAMTRREPDHKLPDNHRRRPRMGSAMYTA